MDKNLQPTTEVISQRYNRFHRLNRKDKTSERIDTRFNGRYEFIHKRTPQHPPPFQSAY